MNPDTVPRPADAPNPGAIGFPTTTSQADGAPTLPSDAESLLKHLRLGLPRPEASTPAGGFPHIPNYAIESELGRGGMGVVYLARHAALHHTVAVKMILTSAYTSSNEVARFVAEAEAVAAVKHPNVVQVHDLGESAGRPYFVMEYVEGGTLARHLKSGPLDPNGAAALIEAVARGAQAAHDAGIVHRDLKPGNILLQVKSHNVESRKAADSALGLYDLTTLRLADATPKVSDFGLAKRLLSDVTRSIAVLGTPAYMAPEQAGGKAKFVGPQADVYALGVVLYECLTGRVPFEADDPWALIQLVLENPPEPPRRRAPGVPRDLELIVLKCLEKEPHHRYPTAAALADDLARFLRGEPVSVRPIGAPTRALRWAKKRPAAAALSALGVLLLLTVPPLAVWVQGQFSRRAAVAEEAQQKEEAARRAEAEANRARAEEEKSRIAAEQLADARELFGLQNKFRNRAAARPLGWTAATRAEVPRALALAGGDSQVAEELRSAAAGALLAHDLFPMESVAKALSGSVLATDPKSGLVAVGEFKAWGDCRVLLVDPASGRTMRKLTFPTAVLFGSGPLDPIQDGTRALAFSPDGTRLYVGTRSSKVMRFDLHADKDTPAASWKAATHTLEQLAVSPDGKTVYGLCPPEVPVFAWAADSGKPLPPQFPDEAVPIKTFAVLGCGDLIAGNGRKLYRWKADGTLVRSVPNSPGFRLAPVSGSMLLLGEGSLLDVLDGETFESTARLSDPHLRRAAHEGYVRSIVVHPSGAFVATAADDSDRTVKVWELASGRLIGTVASAGTGPVAVAWSGDGTCLLATSEGRVERWRFAPAEAQRFACFAGPPLEAAAFVPGSQVAAVGAALRQRRELLVGAAAGGPSQAVYLTDPSGNWQAGLAADPTGTLAITTQNPGIVLRKPDDPVAEPAFSRQVASTPRFDPDGRTLWAVVDSKTVRRYDPVTKAELGKWSNSIAGMVSGLASVDALAVGRKGAVAGGRDGAIHLLDPTTCKPTTSFRIAGGPVTAVALAPDEAFAAGGTQSGKLRLIGIDDKTEHPAVMAHPGGVTAVAIGRDGTLLATGGRDRAVRLWKKSGDRFEPLLAVADLPGAVTALQFNPADGRLLVALASEHAVRVWDVNLLNAQLAELKLGW